ncbi:hypothetical protein C8R45DRAFT_182884 [Mycena sanguinolenta]|nr:hypothetical protein C8R45DRAFT_182884 [Mycena sanguinolenta]
MKVRWSGEWCKQQLSVYYTVFFGMLTSVLTTYSLYGALIWSFAHFADYMISAQRAAQPQGLSDLQSLSPLATPTCSNRHFRSRTLPITIFHVVAEVFWTVSSHFLFCGRI